MTHPKVTSNEWGGVIQANRDSLGTTSPPQQQLLSLGVFSLRRVEEKKGHVSFWSQDLALQQKFQLKFLTLGISPSPTCHLSLCHQ